MRTSYSAIVVYLLLLMTSCTTMSRHEPTQVTSNFIHRQTVVKTTSDHYPAKNPQNVALYTYEKTPHMPYRIIGVAKVSKYNLLGMERHHDKVEEMMKTLAASVGGDGLIDVKHTEEETSANIIAFQKILI